MLKRIQLWIRLRLHISFEKAKKANSLSHTPPRCIIRTNVQRRIQLYCRVYDERFYSFNSLCLLYGFSFCAESQTKDQRKEASMKCRLSSGKLYNEQRGKKDSNHHQHDWARGVGGRKSGKKSIVLPLVLWLFSSIPKNSHYYRHRRLCIVWSATFTFLSLSLSLSVALCIHALCELTNRPCTNEAYCITQPTISPQFEFKISLYSTGKVSAVIFLFLFVLLKLCMCTCSRWTRAYGLYRSRQHEHKHRVQYIIKRVQNELFISLHVFAVYWKSLDIFKKFCMPLNTLHAPSVRTKNTIFNAFSFSHKDFATFYSHTYLGFYFIRWS